MTCPLLPAWARAALLRFAGGLARACQRTPFCAPRRAHHGESIAYYQAVERRDARSKGALWL